MCSDLRDDTLDCVTIGLHQLRVRKHRVGEPFELEVDAERGCLRGRTEYCDSVDDEWFVVFLLRSLTAAFPELTVAVSDGDGEFLLIEAALALPPWLEPDTSENRVFLRGGALHVVGPSLAPLSADGARHGARAESSLYFL